MVSPDIQRKRELLLIERVDVLNEEVKVLALNLAIYLAKAKEGSAQLRQLEPDFIRLVNGTVKVVQELAHIINAARNQSRTPATINDPIHSNQIEIRLRSILDQCAKIMNSLAKTGHLSR